MSKRNRLREKHEISKSWENRQRDGKERVRVRETDRKINIKRGREREIDKEMCKKEKGRWRKIERDRHVHRFKCR